MLHDGTSTTTPFTTVIELLPVQKKKKGRNYYGITCIKIRDLKKRILDVLEAQLYVICII